MKLSTEVDFGTVENQPNYDSELLLMGSCFSEHIGSWMRQLQFKATANPGGIIYNPLSLAQQIVTALGDVPGNIEVEMQQSQGLFVHTDFHSSFAHPNKDEAVEAITKALRNTGEALRSASHVFVTFGTSVVFTKKKTSRVANNCHKLASNQFEKSMASLESMAEAMLHALNQLRQANPNVHIYLTVSPVRHMRHGAVENQRSKARLILLCEQLCANIKGTKYLPVYEFAMDELRDYRYFRHDDLIHLGQAGLNLLKERLELCLFDGSTRSQIQKVKQWLQMKNHRILHPDTLEAQSFLRKLDKQEKDIKDMLKRPLNGFYHLA